MAIFMDSQSGSGSGVLASPENGGATHGSRGQKVDGVARSGWSSRGLKGAGAGDAWQSRIGIRAGLVEKRHCMAVRACKVGGCADEATHRMADRASRVTHRREVGAADGAG